MATRRKGMVLLVVAVLMVAPVVASAAGPVDGGADGWWGSVEKWLAGLVGGWWGGGEVGAASEVGPDGTSGPDGTTQTDSTDREEEPTPDGELGPWVDPNGVADKGSAE